TDPDALYGAPGDPKAQGYAEQSTPTTDRSVGVDRHVAVEAVANVMTEIQRIAREASTAQVAIHTVNTQGVPHSTDMMLKGVSSRSTEELIESSASNALASLAIGTGGVASRGNNDFLPALRKVEKEARATYVVSYVPSG